MKLFFFSSTETDDILTEQRVEGEEETRFEIFEEQEKPKAVPDPVSVADIFARRETELVVVIAVGGLF